MKCPKCKQKDNVILVKEFVHYSELIHDNKSCQFQWTFSTYGQCKHLQKEKRDRLFIERDVFKADKESTGGAKTLLKLGVYSIFLPLKIVGVAKPTNDFMIGKINNQMIKTAKDFATRDSYEIEDAFATLENHYLDEKFLEEQKPFVTSNYSLPSDYYTHWSADFMID